ncbi:MAG: radical SAM protein, partial [Planctomycetota bacterium]
MAAPRPLITDDETFEHLLDAEGLSRNEARRFRGRFFQRGESREELEAVFPILLSVIKRVYSFRVLALVKRLDSSVDGATKLLYEAADGCRIESVLLRLDSGRSSVCISSQAGCSESCRFCATGRMGLKRNLTHEEMVDQVLQARQLLREEGRTLRNVVFMGMGEPLQNLDAVMAAVAQLVNPRTFHLAPRHVTLSTVGLPDPWQTFARRFPEVQLSLSLNSAVEETRARLMPVAERVSLAELRSALVAVTSLRRREVMVSVILFDGVNDGPGDLEALLRFVEGLP